MRRVLLATAMVAAGLASVALAGCGSPSPGITEAASTQLELRVQSVRNAAEARDRALAEARLAELRRSVADFRARDEISKDRADKVLAAAVSVETRLQAIPTTTTTTTTTPPTTRDQDEDRPGKDKGGKGKNGGGGD
jgi:predicted component of type VI protein secretion system